MPSEFENHLESAMQGGLKQDKEGEGALIEVKVPVFPESVNDGTIVAWHKKPGDAVRRDENLVDIETDKVMFEVPATEDGVLQQIYQDVGAVVVSGQVLAAIAPGIGSGAPSAKSTGATATRPVHAERESSVEAGGSTDRPIAPSARKLIAERGLSESEIAGSGKGGRITKEDVLNYEAVQGSPEPAESPRPAESPAPVPPVAAPPSPVVEFPAGSRPEKRVTMTRLRARIAERLVEAQQTAAILTTFNEVNMQPVMTLRKKYRDQFEKEFGVRLGFMGFFIKAAVEALKKFPVVNASVDGDDIVYHGFFDIGVAVSSPRGLVVPIIRNADQLGIAEIESQIGQFAERARTGSLAIEEITGGTFTITNGGVFGSLLSTPILNPPQSAILGMHKVQDRPVVEEGQVVVRPMMYLALSYDHRIVDGREAVQFLVTIKEQLEDPARMLLEI